MTQPRYPSVRIRLTIGRYISEQFALADTGCDAAVVVPVSLISELPSPARRRRVVTASGEQLHAFSYRGLVEVLDQPSSFGAWILALGDEYLLGCRR